MISDVPAVETVVVHAARLAPSPSDKVFSIVRLDTADLVAAPRLDEALKQVPGASLFRRTSSLSANPTSRAYPCAPLRHRVQGGPW